MACEVISGLPSYGMHYKISNFQRWFANRFRHETAFRTYLLFASEEIKRFKSLFNTIIHSFR